MSWKEEYGDYQTPAIFADQICHYLKEKRQLTPQLIIEPTCGTGQFLKSSLIFERAEIVGIEINKEYCAICKERVKDRRVKVINADFFSFDFKPLLKERKNVLALGNPPWVTNSALSVMNSANRPEKNNCRGNSGIAALTGASNFDISEDIIMRLLETMNTSDSTLAMLCKKTVARKIFRELKRKKIGFKTFDLVEFAAKEVFAVAVDACLLVIELAADVSPSSCNIYSFSACDEPIGQLNYLKGRLFKDFSNQNDFLGKCSFTWRQGVKHDCAKVMELSVKGNGLFNGLNEAVEIEERCIYPLVKSSMFKSALIKTFSKYVLITQRNLKEDTARLEKIAPKTRNYLQAHAPFFARRKSRIYQNRAKYALFGIGDYAFAPYKVALSGFYKEPLFALLYSEDTKPVMVDDTCYYLAFATYNCAYTALLILNSEAVRSFLKSLIFYDAKRPYTKSVLALLDFSKILKKLKSEDLSQSERKLGLEPYFNEEMLKEFLNLPELKQSSQESL